MVLGLGLRVKSISSGPFFAEAFAITIKVPE